MVLKMEICVLFFFMISVNVCRTGVIEVVDACTMCSKADSVLRCDLNTAAVVSVEDCPGAHLWTGSTFIVTDLRGWASQVHLSTTTLTCEDLPVDSIAVLNGEKCEDAAAESAATTTTTKRTPWWPIPFPLPAAEDDDLRNVTMNATATTRTSQSTETTTVMIAISTAFRVNGTVVIVTIAVAVTAIGMFCCVRCVRRRQRQRPAVQVAEVSSTTTFATLSPHRRRRRDQGSYESIELFAQPKRD